MDASPLQDRRAARGGIALVATLQYLLAEYVVAAAWPSPYSLSANYVSDLGVPECLVLDRVVCSPQWFVADASWVVQGVIAIVAVWSLAWLVPGRWRLPVTVLGVLHGVGFVLVGVFPGLTDTADDVRATIHLVGAVLVLGAGGLVAIVAGLAMRAQWRRWSIASIALGGISLAATAVSPWSDLGLGVGGIERLGIYPIIAWLVLTGLAMLATRRSEAERLRIHAAQTGTRD